MRSVFVLLVTLTLLVLNAMGPRRAPPRPLGTARDYPSLARFLRAQAKPQPTSLVATR